MNKELIKKGIGNLEKIIKECEVKIENGGNEKSLKSLICGYKKDLDLLLLINGELDEVSSNKLISRLGRLGLAEWVEISREDYLKEEGYFKENYKVTNGKFYRK
nr:MAG TPA: hypothetical protein [Caudoviricetes sp.]